MEIKEDSQHIEKVPPTQEQQQLLNILARSYQGHCGDNCMCDKCKEYGIGIYFVYNSDDG